MTTLTILLHASASERDGLAMQFQATAAEAAASFRKELKVNLTKSIRPSMRLHARLVVGSKHLENVDRRELPITTSE